jgi:hypothetical protein
METQVICKNLKVKYPIRSLPPTVMTQRKNRVCKQEQLEVAIEDGERADLHKVKSVGSSLHLQA